MFWLFRLSRTSHSISRWTSLQVLCFLLHHLCCHQSLHHQLCPWGLKNCAFLALFVSVLKRWAVSHVAVSQLFFWLSASPSTSASARPSAALRLHLGVFIINKSGLVLRHSVFLCTSSSSWSGENENWYVVVKYIVVHQQKNGFQKVCKPFV